MCCKKYSIKGECLFILNRKLIYYTKELLKVLRTASIAFIIVMAIILIKYTPQYEVSIDGEIIGYVESQKQIDKYISERVEAEEGKKLASHRNVSYWDYFVKNVQIDGRFYIYSYKNIVYQK